MTTYLYFPASILPYQYLLYKLQYIAPPLKALVIQRTDSKNSQVISYYIVGSTCTTRYSKLLQKLSRFQNILMKTIALSYRAILINIFDLKISSCCIYLNYFFQHLLDNYFNNKMFFEKRLNIPLCILIFLKQTSSSTYNFAKKKIKSKKKLANSRVHCSPSALFKLLHILLENMSISIFPFFFFPSLILIGAGSPIHEKLS